MQGKVKSTEEMEMERITELKKELELKRKIAEESRRMALASHGYKPVQSKQELTKPDKIHFATDDRLKNPADNKLNTSEVNDFPKMLRHTRSRSVSVA